MRVFYLTLIAAGLFLASCSEALSPYTTSVQRSANIGEEQVKQIQFYLSDDIVMQRQLSATETTITEGELKIVGGREVQEIVIPAGTPGVVTGLSGNILHVSFDANGEYLRFGPNPGAGGRYTVMAYDKNGVYGYVMYGTQEFKLASYNNHYAHLLLDMERYDEVTKERKEVSGRTLSP